jgi:hypothetical protein
MYHANFKLHQFINSLSDDTIQWFMVQAEQCVRRRHPHAVMMYSTDRKGKPTHVGIYDCRLLLNERHTFSSNKQYAPQQLNEPMPWSDDWEPAYKVRYLENMWATLAVSMKLDADAHS